MRTGPLAGGTSGGVREADTEEQNWARSQHRPSHTGPRGGHGLRPRTKVRRPRRSRRRGVRRRAGEGPPCSQHSWACGGNRPRSPGRPERSCRGSCGLSPGARSCRPPLGQAGGDPSPAQRPWLPRRGAPRGLQGGTAQDGQRGRGLALEDCLTSPTSPRPQGQGMSLSNCPRALESPGVLPVAQVSSCTNLQVSGLGLEAQPGESPQASTRNPSARSKVPGRRCHTASPSEQQHLGEACHMAPQVLTGSQLGVIPTSLPNAGHRPWVQKGLAWKHLGWKGGEGTRPSSGGQADRGSR